MTIGIECYAYELGSMPRSVDEIASFCTVEERAHMKTIGLERIPTDNERLLWDMVSLVCEKIEGVPDCVLVAHSLPFIKRNNGFADLKWNVPVFFLSGLPCAIMHKAVEIGKKLILGKRFRKVLVIGADKAYSDKERVFFGTIMGDGVIAVLLSDSAEANSILSCYISTTIIAPDGENSNPNDIAEFRSLNALLMRDAILKCIRPYSVADISCFITHTSNRQFWDAMAQLMHVQREKFMDQNIKYTGHLNSNDSFYHYLRFCEQNLILSGSKVLLINPGFGGTQGCTLIER